MASHKFSGAEKVDRKSVTCRLIRPAIAPGATIIVRFAGIRLSVGTTGTDYGHFVATGAELTVTFDRDSYFTSGFGKLRSHLRLISEALLSP